MTRPRLLVVEPEEFARCRLLKALGRRADVEMLGAASEAKDAARQIAERRPDILVLDCGLACCLQAVAEPPMVIATGTEVRHSLEAWALGAVDFLLKPIAAGPLGAAIDRACRALTDAEATQRAAELEALVVQLRREADAREGRRYATEFWARSRGHYVRIRAADIDWIEAERDYVRLHTGEASYLHLESLGAIEERLDPAAFRRVHRSAIVRWDRIREVRRAPGSGLTLVSGAGAEIRVGRTFAPGLMGALSPRWAAERRAAAR